MEKPLTGAMRPDGKALSRAEYEKTGGYEALKKVLRQMTPKEVQEIVKAANLRGRGGAGFPTGVKWGFTPIGEGAPRPKFLISNSDEMEPGAFKDRVLMEGNPHQLIEGMIIAAYAIEAENAYVFLRWGYGASGRRIAAAIREAYEAGYLGPSVAGSRYALEMHVHVSAGRYICGEETALLNALEGKRAIPRAKPPFPGTNGLWGKPTVVNNAETLANVPHIVRHGPEWYKGLSLSDDGGTKVYAVAGRVKRPGWWELPMGTTIRELLEEHAGGMRRRIRREGRYPRRRLDGVRPARPFRYAHDFRRHGKKGGQPHGDGHHDRPGRCDLPNRHGPQPRGVFCPRVVRLVHPLP